MDCQFEGTERCAAHRHCRNSVLRTARGTVSARWRARASPGPRSLRVEAELAALYRERAIQRAKAAECDPTLPLQ